MPTSRSITGAPLGTDVEFGEPSTESFEATDSIIVAPDDDLTVTIPY